MVNVRVLFVAAVLAYSATAAQATTFSDTFNSNPFIGGLERWCERFPHVHWDSVGTYVRGSNGTSCTNLDVTKTTPLSAVDRDA
jgi:hypothetical protein